MWIPGLGNAIRGPGPRLPRPLWFPARAGLGNATPAGGASVTEAFVVPALGRNRTGLGNATLAGGASVTEAQASVTRSLVGETSVTEAALGNASQGRQASQVKQSAFGSWLATCRMGRKALSRLWIQVVRKYCQPLAAFKLKPLTRMPRNKQEDASSNSRRP